MLHQPLPTSPAGQVECLDCGLVREPEPSLVPVGGPESAGGAPGPADTTLADEVGRALDRLLGRR